MNAKDNKIFEIANNIFCKNKTLQKRNKEKLGYLEKILLGIHWTKQLIGLTLICLFSVADPALSMQKAPPIKMFESTAELFPSELACAPEALREFFDALSTGRGTLLVYNAAKFKVVLGSFSQVKKVDELALALSPKSLTPILRLRPLDSVLLAGNIVQPIDLMPDLAWPEKIREFIDNLGSPDIAKTHMKELVVVIRSAETYIRIIAMANNFVSKVTEFEIILPEQVSVMNNAACNIMHRIWHYLVEKGNKLSPDEIIAARNLLMVGNLDQALKGIGCYAPLLSKIMDIDQNQIKMAIGWWAKAMHTEIQMLALARSQALPAEIKPLPGIGVFSWLNPCQKSCREMIDSSTHLELLPFLYFREDEHSKVRSSTSVETTSHGGKEE